MRLIILVISLLFCGAIVAQSTLNLVPWPAELKQSEGAYIIKSRLTLRSDFPNWDKQPLFNYLKNELQKYYGINISKAAKGQKADVQILMRRMPGSGKQ
ncbi:MAG TPA: hypothetical protein VFX58_17685, partial [Chitinophagaceae bacterium]|nr:hypothetical protein [Chitinophagaceae bacterium]